MTTLSPRTPAPGGGAFVVPAPDPFGLDAITAALRARFPQRSEQQVRTAALRVRFNLERFGPVTPAPGLSVVEVLIDRTLAYFECQRQRAHERRLALSHPSAPEKAPTVP